MKTLMILQGIPGSGKSTFIKNNNLEEYTLCPDTLRSMFSALQMGENEMGIDQKKNNMVFKILETMLDSRMNSGAFTVVDATHCSKKALDMYKRLIKRYHYRMVLVTFSVDAATAIARNESRGYKKVPNDVIYRMAKNLEEFDYEKWYSRATPENWKDFAQQRFENLSNYSEIVHIGDIHGCNVPLNEISIKKDKFYIFLGDYIDRGTENGKVLQMLMSYMALPNVVLLKGNHELHIERYLETGKIDTKEFGISINQILSDGISESELKEFIKKLREVYAYTYNGKKVVCTHGGIPFMPEDLRYIDPIQYVKGVSDYGFDVDKAWESHNPEIFQIHGHRNLFRYGTIAQPHSFNLNSSIEDGEPLRVLTLSSDGWQTTEIPNPVYRSPEEKIFLKLSHDKDIAAKEQDGVTSFNFTKETFWEKRWNENTIQARGLFCDSKTYKVLARGYEKFFAVDENELSSLEVIKNLKYPLNAYVKENGYLGILGVHNGELMFASKSSIKSDFQKWFRQIFEATADSKKVLDYLVENNACMVFEVVDEVNDPHIINYGHETKKIILLDIMKREYKFERVSYPELVSLAKEFNLTPKKLAWTFADFDSLREFLETTDQFGYTFENLPIEGFVVEDSSDDVYHFKIKTGYYKFWKAIRGYFENGSVPEMERKTRLFRNLKLNKLEEMIPLAEKILLNHKPGDTLFDMQEKF